MIIHYKKEVNFENIGKDVTACNIVLKPSQSTLDIKKVTCKICLKVLASKLNK